MANVQSSINQMLSLAGLLASQSPAIKAGAEKRMTEKNLKAREEIIQKKRESMTGPAVLQNVQAAEAESEDILQEERDIAKARYDIDPTEETYEALSKAEKALHPKTFTFEADPEEIARERAAQLDKEEQIKTLVDQFRKPDDNLKQRVEAQRETRRRILEGTPSEYMLRGDNLWQQK